MLLKNQSTKDVSEERENYRCETKHKSPGGYEIISSLRSQIDPLQSK